MKKMFQLIVADCPWSFSDRLTMSDVPRGAAANYQLMTNKDIENLPIKDYADPEGCILALWVPSSLLQEGMNTMKAWGFDQKQTYVWVKIKKDPFINLSSSIKKSWKNISSSKNMKKDLISLIKDFSLDETLAFFMGRLFRQTHEIALIGINNKKIYKKLKNKSQRSVSFAENLKHSAKPEALQDSLELMFPEENTKKLELFARRVRPGWICLGNEIDGLDIRDALAKL